MEGTPVQKGKARVVARCLSTLERKLHEMNYPDKPVIDWGPGHSDAFTVHLGRMEKLVGSRPGESICWLADLATLVEGLNVAELQRATDEASTAE